MEEIAEQIKQLDPKLQPTDPAYQAATFLIASLMVGPVQYKIQHLTKLPKGLVAMFAHHCRKNKIWFGGKIHADWANEETGGLAFWCDVNVLTGMFERA